LHTRSVEFNDTDETLRRGEGVRRFLTITYQWARRCVIAVVGGTVVIVGVVMIVLPGPAIVVIPAGLAILAIEFECARRWLHYVKSKGGSVMHRCRDWQLRRRAAKI
jgi:uncharacterized protein (TIGR02611 family)